MKLPISYSLLFSLVGIFIFFSCKKDSVDDINCDEEYFIPASYMDWFPYYSTTGNMTPNKFFELENETFFMTNNEFTFFNESLDSQVWKLVHVVEKFNQHTYNVCPLYQQVKYTIYNSDIDQHISLGFIYRDTSFVSSSENTELYIPMIQVGACVTKHENAEGILGGTCYTTSFDINNYASNSKVEFLNTFETDYGSYDNVFLLDVNHNPDHLLDYDIYITKDHGIIAYENQNVLWELK